MACEVRRESECIVASWVEGRCDFECVRVYYCESDDTRRVYATKVPDASRKFSREHSIQKA